MRRVSPATPGLLLLLVVAGCASTETSDGDFAALEQRWVAAVRAHDTATLDRLLDDSFLDSTFRGALRTKNDVLTGPPAGGSYHSIGFEDLRVRRYGETVIVSGVNVVQGSTPDDLARVRFTDVFVRRDGQWRAVAAQETLQSSS